MPTTKQFVDALRQLEAEGRLPAKQKAMLIAQYHAPERTMTSPELAEAVGYAHHGGTNFEYGGLGHKLADLMNYPPPRRGHDNSPQYWAVLADGVSSSRGFLWSMRPELARALEYLGWVNTSGDLYAGELDEVELPETYPEGSVRRVLVNNYERSSVARAECIAEYGTRCFICGFDFKEKYGEAGRGFIHVHHEMPLSEVGEEYQVDPINEMKPVCPNCHAIIHRRRPAYTIAEMRKMLTDG